MNKLKTAQLGEIADVNWGDTNVTKSSYVAGGFPAFSATGSDGFLPYADFDRDAIVLSAIGARCGKTWFTTGKWSCIKNTIRYWSTSNDVDNRYLYWATFGEDFWPKRGAAQPFITIGDARRLSIFLPSLPEQRRIVAILDQADALRAKRREALAQLDSLTQSIFIEMFGDPARNSLGLPLASLSELGSWHSGGTPPRGEERYFNGDIPWFSSGELEAMYVSKSMEHISEDAVRQTSAKLVPSGSLMLGMYDTAALKASIANVDCSCNQAIAFAKIRPEIAETVYVYYAIIVGREHFRRLQRGVRQKNLNLSMIRDIQIPAPSIEHQQNFSERVQALESVKVVHQAALTELDTLFAALQHRAFQGEL